jgi:hypothetical protein
MLTGNPAPWIAACKTEAAGILTATSGNYKQEKLPTGETVSAINLSGVPV